MAERIVELRGKVDDIKARLEEARRALRQLKREQQDSGKVTEEQKEKTKELRRTLEDLRDEGKKYRRELKEQQLAERKTTKARKDASKAIVENGKAIAAAAAAAALATGKALKASAEQQRVERELAFAFRSTGQTRKESLESVSAALEVFAKNQKETIFGDEEQARALATIIRTTEDASEAQKLLTLSMDTASASGKNLEEVSKAIARARGGNIESLQEFGLLTKAQSDDVNKLDDNYSKWLATLKLVEGRVDGARLEVGELSQTLAQLENDTGDAVQALGDLVAVSAEVTGVVDGNKSLIGDFAADVSLGAKAIKVLNDNLSTSEKVMLAAQVPLSFLAGPLGFKALEKNLEGAAEKAAKFLKDSQGIDDRLANINRQTGGDVTLRSGQEGLISRSDFEALGVGARGKKKPKRPKKEDEGFDFSEDEVEKFQRQVDVQRLELELLQEKDALKRLEIEHGLRILEITDAEMTAENEAVALAIESEQHEEAKLNLKREQIDRQIAFNTLLEDEEATRKAIAEEEEKKAKKDAEKAAEDASKKRLEIIGASIDATGQLADAVIESESASAVIKAAMATGQALLALAQPVPNIPGAIAGFASAAQFGIAASMGGKSAASAKQGTGAGAEAGGVNAQEVQRENARLLGEEIRRSGAPTGSATQINVNFRHVGKVTSEEARLMADAVESEMANRR